MKTLFKIFLIVLFLSNIFFAQYQDSGKRGIYFSKKNYSDSGIPDFESNKKNLPSPILEENPEYIDLYWAAWKLAFQHFKKPPQGSPFVSNYIDEAFSPSIFQWDTIFMLMFARYAYNIFPAIQSLDNFYSRQYENGYICREIVEETGEDFVYEGRENTINPPIFSWAEIESFKLTGDKSRFAIVLPVLEKYAEWLEKYRKKENTKHNLYWQTGLGSGMDNSPRSGSGWVDMSSQIVMQYRNMAYMCHELNLTEKEKLYNSKADEISERINKFMWNEVDGVYYDVDDNGNQIKCKTVASFWPMLAGVSNTHQSEKLYDNLRNPHLFWRKIPFPSLAADEKDYKSDGEYWLGAVWASTNVMIIKGLDKIANDLLYENPSFLKSPKVFNEFASLASEKYVKGIYEVYKKTGTIWENYSAEDYERGNPSQPNFVGWSGCGPIELLIENIIGIHPNAIDNEITWYIHRKDKHGIENLHFGDNVVSLICDKREDITQMCNLEIIAKNDFNLKLINWKGEVKILPIKKGKENISIN